jgi:uncharacterized membrane protein YeaQ/YmgE (transglycosylase-associated protein family)
MFHILWMFIVGIVVGAIARLVIPQSEHLGLFTTGVLGIVGSSVGGFIARIFDKLADGALVHPAGSIMSVIGALILLYAWKILPSERPRRGATTVQTAAPHLRPVQAQGIPTSEIGHKQTSVSAVWTTADRPLAYRFS